MPHSSWRLKLFLVLPLASCASTTLTPVDLFFNAQVIAARDAARGAGMTFPFSCFDANDDHICKAGELTTTASIAGQWTLSGCSVRGSSGGVSGPCTLTTLSFDQEGQVLTWKDAPHYGSAGDNGLVGGDQGWLVDGANTTLMAAFPRLSDDSGCEGITLVGTRSAQGGDVTLLEVTTQPAGGTCTPRAAWVYSQGTLTKGP